MSQSSNSYRVERIVIDSIPVVRLVDATRGIEVSIAPSLGNNAYEMKVHGAAVLWSPYSTLRQFAAKPVLLGVPLLAPWANRLDEDAFYANGKRYAFDDGLGNIRRDQFKQPIHGLLASANRWRVVETGADERAAWVSSRLDFWRDPDWMAQFPFAHTIEMTHRLSNGALEVHLAIENLSDDPMPLQIGFHPYFAIPRRDEWQLRLPARERVVLSDTLIPTGERKPMDLPDPLPLRGARLDDVFTGLVRNANGRAEFRAENGSRRITVAYGPGYPVAVIYAPPGRDFVCFEPMTAITDALNLAARGKYEELQRIPPGGTWEESFWISASGY
jgi:aldose 1-epimerase